MEVVTVVDYGGGCHCGGLSTYKYLVVAVFVIIKRFSPPLTSQLTDLVFDLKQRSATN